VAGAPSTARRCFVSAVGLSELYNGVLADLVTAELGVGWTPERRRHSAVEKWEVTGVGEVLRAEFSQRTTEIEQAKDVLVERFVAGHGRHPTAREVLQLRQQATLTTRPDKHVKPLTELLQGWRSRAEPFVGDDPQAWVATLAGRNDLPLLTASDLSVGMLEDAARVAAEVVSGKRATFTRVNVLAEVLRQFAGVRFMAPGERVAVAERVADLALARSVALTPPEVGVLPDALRRPDGSSRFRPRSSEVFTTAALIDAEERSLRGVRPTGPPSARSSPCRSRRRICPEGAIPCRRSRPRRCARWSAPGVSWTFSSGRLGRGSRPRWPGSGPVGKPHLARGP
jgi:hypothetical protein